MKELGKKLFMLLFLGVQIWKPAISSSYMAKLGRGHVECFVGIVPTIVLSGHSLNLVQPFSRGDKNKLMAVSAKQ